MKALLLAGVVCCIAISSFGQDKSISVKDKAYYLQKSKKQFTAGLITLGLGIGLLALNATNEQGIEDIGTNIILIGGGGIATIYGTILLISSAGNKAKAKRATAFIAIDKMIIAQNMHLQRIYYPRIGLRINR